MFLMMGIIYFVMGLISVPMIFTPREEETPGDMRLSQLEPQQKKSLKPMEVLKTPWFYQVIS